MDMDMGSTTLKDKHQTQQGNVLFLILIAVALFAALSYAVTQSGRGGGNADKEKQEMKIAEFFQQEALIRTFVLRQYTLNKVDQVRFDDSAYNENGTVLNGSSTGTGRSVGIFNPIDGIHKIYPPIELAENLGSTFDWSLKNAPLRFLGNEIGTTAGDEVLVVWRLSKEVCEAINLKLTGSKAIPITSDLAGGRYEVLRQNGAFSSGLTGSHDLGLFPGCNERQTFTSYIYFSSIRDN